jgi:hypothetical protein
MLEVLAVPLVIVRAMVAVLKSMGNWMCTMGPRVVTTTFMGWRRMVFAVRLVTTTFMGWRRMVSAVMFTVLTDCKSSGR